MINLKEVVHQWSSIIHEHDQKEQELFDYLDNNEVLGDFLVLIRIDNNGEYYNKIEYLSYNGDDNTFTWENDWWEGEDFEFLGFIYPEDIPEELFRKLVK